MPRRLNLDHVGAEVREQQRSIRAVIEVGEIEHADVVERANWHEAPLGARAVSRRRTRPVPLIAKAARRSSAPPCPTHRERCVSGVRNSTGEIRLATFAWPKSKAASKFIHVVSAKSKVLGRPIIVVSTGQNEVAKVLNRYARSFVASGFSKNGQPAIHLGPPKSVSRCVQSELRKRPNASLFFFGHGLEPPAVGFVGHDSKPAVGKKTVGLLRGRHVGATCCYGNRLGKTASISGFSLFGYSDELIVPTLAKDVRMMEAAFLAGPHALAAGQSVVRAAYLAADEFRRVAQFLQQRNRKDDKIMARLFLFNANRAGAWS